MKYTINNPPVFVRSDADITALCMRQYFSIWWFNTFRHYVFGGRGMARAVRWFSQHAILGYRTEED